LSISAKLATLMGGRLWVESEPERGSRFHFTAVLERAAVRETAAPSRVPAARVPSRPLRVLLFEDDVINRMVATRLLEMRGHGVLPAADWRVLLGPLDDRVVDLVVIDTETRHINALDAVAAIRGREVGTGRRLPMVATATDTTHGARERCLAAGMDSFVTRPIRVSEFIEAIDRVATALSRPNTNLA
jgi:two-component system CheB/CheR fusion protein